jgi:acetylglutamate kinase
LKILIKIGGTLLDNAESRDRLAVEIAAAAARDEVVVVHGGGKQMTRYLAERGLESRFVNGLRVTTPEVLDAVLKIFAGTVNAQLVASFRAAGAKPVGLTGIDAGLVDAEVMNAELGHVGRPIRSNSALLNLLVGDKYLPVVACVAGDASGSIYNVNGDQMATACAIAFGAAKLIFLTDVEGVRCASGEAMPVLTAAQASALIHDGVATGGMRAKLEAALTGLEGGVPEIQIAPGFHSGIIQRLVENSQIGTRIKSHA